MSWERSRDSAWEELNTPVVSTAGRQTIRPQGGQQRGTQHELGDAADEPVPGTSFQRVLDGCSGFRVESRQPQLDLFQVGADEGVVRVVLVRDHEMDVIRGLTDHSRGVRIHPLQWRAGKNESRCPGSEFAATCRECVCDIPDGGP